MTFRRLAPICSLAVTILGERLVTAVRGLAFWTAALLPFAYVPLLVGHPSGELLGSVLAVHVVALVVGHGYRRDARE